LRPFFPSVLVPSFSLFGDVFFFVCFRHMPSPLFSFLPPSAITFLPDFVFPVPWRFYRVLKSRSSSCPCRISPLVSCGAPFSHIYGRSFFQPFSRLPSSSSPPLLTFDLEPMFSPFFNAPENGLRFIGLLPCLLFTPLLCFSPTPPDAWDPYCCSF